MVSTKKKEELCNLSTCGYTCRVQWCNGQRAVKWGWTLPSSSPSCLNLACTGQGRSCGSAEGTKPLPLRFVISPLRKKHHHIMLKRVKGKVGGPGWDDSPHINLGLISAGSYSHKLTPLLWDLSFLMPFRTVAGTKMLSLSKWADCFTNFHGCFSCADHQCS